jgi:hypothetical protein
MLDYCIRRPYMTDAIAGQEGINEETAGRTSGVAICRFPVLVRVSHWVSVLCNAVLFVSRTDPVHIEAGAEA